MDPKRIRSHEEFERRVDKAIQECDPAGRLSEAEEDGGLTLADPGSSES